ncbi:peptide chain release factor N(5)-glutamine methyltransferase [Candidatus Dependentiae bacterium]|nr:peptide chain release factor N(5)-glutamine methyltransferase [Candidatus Dependentiae bacterium]
MKTVTTTITDIANKLHTRYQDPILCQQYAWWMLEALTGKTIAHLLAQKTFTLNSAQQQTLQLWIDQQIKRHIPLQYLLGNVPFADLEILVEPPTLIPRPETEEWAIKLAEQLNRLTNKKIAILDIATGSGCIALALAKQLPHATVWGSDISEKAIVLAKKNAQHNTITNASFLVSDIFGNIPLQVQFDIIVSNPPYISLEEWKQLDTSVTTWEDKNALVANNDGLKIIESIISGALHYIKKNTEFEQKNIPQLIIEIGYRQGKSVKKLMEQYGYTNVVIHKDLEKKDRVVSGSIPHVAKEKQ